GLARRQARDRDRQRQVIHSGGADGGAVRPGHAQLPVLAVRTSPAADGGPPFLDGASSRRGRMAPTFSPGRSGAGLATWCMVGMMDDRWAWVALALAPDVGCDAVRYHRLLSLGSPAEVLHASRRALAEKLGDRAATRVRDFDASGAMEEQRAA